MALPQFLHSTALSAFPPKPFLNPNPNPSLFLSPHHRRRHLPSTALRCSSSFSEKHHHQNNTNSTPQNDVVELPLFPLPLVLFPGAILHLQIFEFRYRIMMHTLLQSDLRFSFFVGGTFEGALREQQALLELKDTAARLRREKETLRNTLNYLSVASAVNDVFPSELLIPLLTYISSSPSLSDPQFYYDLEA